MSITAADRIHSSPFAELTVQRSRIAFHNVATDRVLIEVEVENRGLDRSRPTQLRLEAAPFGAFVRWQPLTAVRVPAIPPGGSTWVRTIARQPRPKPIGSFSGIVPPGLLAAGEAGENPRPVSQGVLARSLAISSLLLGLPARSGELPPDLFDLLDGPRPHWAGNLNVWIARRPVERHMAPRLRVHSGRANLALFCLGDGPDRYAFRMECPDSGWRCALYDVVAGEAVDWTKDPVRESRWHAVPSLCIMLLALRAPESCERGGVQVHVTQRSSGKTAMIEFDLDPAADGPGCCTV